MKTPKELYNEAISDIERVEALTEISGEIKRIVDALKSRELENWSADMLSRALTRLAVLRVNLGAEMADAVAMYDYSYLNRKIKYASEWKPTKDALNKKINRATIQDIDSTITEKLAEDQQKELMRKHYAERLRTLYDATETLISTIQTRIGILKQERSESRYG